MQRNQRKKYGSSSYRDEAPTIDTSQIKFKLQEGEVLNPDLYDAVAQSMAKTLGTAKKKTTNASTQLRKFYEEIVMWEQKVKQSPDKFDEYLPFIKMLNAKAAYAKGRDELVDENFRLLIAACLQQVNSVETMTRFKFFMEAIIGFYKLEKK